MNAVVLLREALSSDFVKMGELAMRIIPELDGATLGSVMILYGIEAIIFGEAASQEELAAHFRNIADALERHDPKLPVLTGIPPSADHEPGFCPRE